MPLPAGEKLGHYEILAPLGAGGMGEVYRARDTQLEREVAIKVLPHALAADPERMARFDREAKILAALNHPNIAVIHGLVESTNGRALVMELVPGETLGSRMRRGAMPLDETLQVARQMAEALEAAHEKGIVHRDLKPGNVMITPTGLVKVLDFGLAAIAQPAAHDPNNSPTLTMGLSQAGMIMGTAAYMSPEQAAGSPVDRRADIWSYGVVLYEMLGGKRLFGADTVAHTLADVLRKEVDYSNLPEATPRPIRDLLQRCLDRDVKNRLQWIGEARVAITKYLANPASDVVVTQAEAAPSRSRFGGAWLVLAAVFAIAAAALAFVHFREVPPEARLVSTTLLPPEGAEFDFAAGNQQPPLPALSPDGTRIVFGARGKEGKNQLWVRRLDSPTAQPLPGTEGAGTPFWSPESRWVGFGQDTKLKKIDIQGGPPVTVADLSSELGGGSWSPQGVIIFGGRSTNFPIMRVAAAGGKPAPAVSMEKDKEASTHKYPWFLPDGRHFLYTTQQAGDIPVRVGSIDEPEKLGKVVAQAHSNAVYAQGHLLYLRDRTLMAQPFDTSKLETTGEPVPLAEGIPTYTTPSRGAGFTVSSNGLLVFASGASGGASRLVWKDRTGKVLGNLGEPTGLIVDIQFSPDRKQVAATVQDRTGQDDLWIYDTTRGIPTRFTFDPARDRNATWSPDGKTIYFRSNRNQGKDEIFYKASNGSGAEQLLITDAVGETPSSVSPDGKLLLYEKLGGKTGRDLWVVPLNPPGGKSEPRPYLETPFNETAGRFSPDGQWVVYQSNESGRPEVYAAPFPGPGGKRQISSGGGERPRWRSDGKEVFYMTTDGELMAAEVAERNGTLEIGRVQKLLDGLATALQGTYDLSPDGQKILMVDQGTVASRPLTLLENWPAALRK